MILYSREALDDFDAIFEGLLRWEKILLSEQFTIEYVAELKEECEKIPHKVYHENTSFLSHKRFGSKVHRYRRNQQTIWYIIYDIGADGNFYVNKIISNYTTID